MADASSSVPVTVRTLLCRRDVDLFLHCWPTVVAASEESFATTVHDDGSLTPEDIARIEQTIPRSRVLRRAEADARMAAQLARHAHARDFRANSVWGLKLLDVALAEPGDCYYLDGDIRFFRPFRGLFTRAALAGRSVFLRDTVWTAYSIRPWHLLDRRKLRVVDGINTGLTLIDRTCYDLDYVDWFLAQADWRVIPAWTEPTCWAALAWRANGHAVDPRQLPNLYPRTVVDSETLGAHFLSAYRSTFAHELAQACATGPSVEVRFEKLGRLGAWSLGWNQLKRKLGNEWARRQQ